MAWPLPALLAWGGAWTDPKSGKTTRYKYDAVLEVAGSPNESPYDPRFDAHSIHRQIMYKNALERTLDVDIFSPPRQDWLNHTDSYFHQAAEK